MPFITAVDDNQRYDLILAGSGFASSFFLREYLEHAPQDARVLVVEMGRQYTHDWRVANRMNSAEPSDSFFDYAGEDDFKWWMFTIGFGGSSNCWSGNTPRFLPADFELKTRYGVGQDWPISYADLEPYYVKTEQWMAISGGNNGAVSPRSQPYPLPPHRLSDAHQRLADAYPEQFFPMPSARPSAPSPGRRVCCSSGVCRICPVDAKFTIDNAMMPVYEDARVSVLTRSQVWQVVRESGRVVGVEVRSREHEDQPGYEVRGDVVGLGANAIFNAAILLRSGFDNPHIGEKLHEQTSTGAEIFMKGVKNFNGSSKISGIGYMGWDGPHRSEAGACMIEAWNTGALRPEHGRWQEVMRVVMVVEDLPETRNRVRISSSGRPIADFQGHSEYGEAGIRRAQKMLPEWMAALPVERIAFETEKRRTDAHIQGTHAMGRSPADSVTDAEQRLHGHDNLYVLGSGSFSSCSPANPTLTLSALSVRSAARMFA
ncbi:MAG: hypothetical protein CMN28_10180 [Salinisphaeraceae bacterium]|nr:hypothetical protein [Salinisphaeraceae bacterium]